MPKEKARSEIGLPEEGVVYIFFGHIKPYKGIEDLVSVFKNRKEALLIAGNAFSQEYKNYILGLCDGNKNIKLVLKRMPLTELQLYLSASDIVIFPFREIDNSGSIVLAQSYAKAIIVRDLPSVRSVTSETFTKYFKTNKDLEKLLDEAANWDLEKMGRFSFENIKDNTPSEIQKRLVEVYKEVILN